MKNTIIYVMGAGRSGTTLVDIIVGNGSSIYSCGELVRVPELNGIPHGSEPGDKAFEFWNGILKKSDYINRQGYDELEKLVSKVDYHRSFPVVFFNLVSNKTRTAYKLYSESLYTSIFSTTKTEFIVDSSKYPSRALALSKYCDLNIKYIYLVRHPADVIRSFKKKDIEQPPKNIFSANIYYFLVNMACNMVLKRIDRNNYTVVQYNRLVSDPVGVLKKIEKELDIDMTDAISRIENDDDLNVSHLFEGNRIRLKDRLKLKLSGYHRKYQLFEYPTIFLNWIWWVRSR